MGNNGLLFIIIIIQMTTLIVIVLILTYVTRRRKQSGNFPRKTSTLKTEVIQSSDSGVCEEYASPKDVEGEYAEPANQEFYSDFVDNNEYAVPTYSSVNDEGSKCEIFIESENDYEEIGVVKSEKSETTPLPGCF
jgi:hypothetical protein